MTVSRLAGRLREIVRSSGGSQAEPRVVSPVAEGSAAPEQATPVTTGLRLAHAAAATLGGTILDSTAGPCVVVDRTYAPDHVHGMLRIGDCACHVHHASPSLSILAGPPPAAHDGSDADAARLVQEVHAPSAPVRAGDILFLDLETTGLAGGAGTYAFLVGCAWFEDGAFRVRQFFMLGHALERALLAAVRERVTTCGPLVTYNGKTFDVPLLETRFLYNRQPVPLGDRPHVDMLHAARRLWRGARPLVSVPGGQTESCALSVLEQVLFGVQRRGDVPGFEIPGRYFAFLRSGDARPLEPVFEHNRLDLISLAAMTARALRLLGEQGHGGDQPRECLGLGRLFGRAGRWREAEAAFARAVSLGGRSWHADDEVVRAEALRALALRCRRTRRYLNAAEHWESIVGLRRCPPGLMHEALEALAVHHEHRSRDLDRARRFAERSRQVAPSTRSAVEQRLARLDRKLAHHTSRVADTRDPRTAPLWK